MSDVRTLYGTLADLAIAYTDEAGGAQSVTAQDLHEVKEETESLHLPTRILIPMQAEGAGDGTGLQLLTVGVSSIFGKITWRIADLYLHASVGEGTGLHSHLPDLILYSGAYAEQIADSGADLGIGTMTFVGLNLQADLIEWPLQSNKWFYGVTAMISYEEILNY